MLWGLRILIVVVFQRNLCPFLLPNSPWLLLSGSPLHDAPYISVADRCGCRQASRAHTLCVCEATLLEVVQNEVLASSCCNNHGSPGKDVTLMVASVSPDLQHPPLHQWYLRPYEAIHAMDTDAAPNHHRRRL